MPPTELDRQRRRSDMREMLATLHQQGIHVDSATLAAMASYIEGKVGLGHVADALARCGSAPGDAAPSPPAPPPRPSRRS